METPRTIGRYEIIRWVASGAMGEIYEARDPVIDRRVAIKILSHELSDRGEAAAWRERFRREARAAGQRQHPNIVTIFDYGEERGNPFFVMEYVDGESLASRMQQSGRLQQDEAVAIILQVLSAIGFAHDNGVIHRDIKPSNILVAKTGVVKVADFGIARTADSDLTIAGDILGTLSYMAPEQLSGGVVDYRVDLFAAGSVLFELLTGARPFQRKGVFETLVKMETEGPENIRTLNPDISPALKDVIDKALAFDPARRYADAAEFSRAIIDAGGIPQKIAAPSMSADQTIVVSRPRTIPPPTVPPGTTPGATGDAAFPLSGGTGSGMPGTGRGARRRRWVVAAGSGLLIMVGGLAAAIFLAPNLIFPQQPKPPSEVAAAQIATAPAADQSHQLQPIRPAGTSTVVPLRAPNPPMQTREAFDPEKVPYVKSREDVRRYGAYTNAKALAISTSGVSWWMSTQRQALEACEFWARKPCILYAIDNLVVPAPEPRPMLGSGVGRFDPAEVPFVSYAAQQKLSVYVSSKNAKALAVSPHGNYGLAGDAATIEEAQRLALERCLTAEKNMAIPEQNKKPCYVYAIGDTVVLAQRLTAPATPVSTPASPPSDPPVQTREAFDPEKVPYVKNRENLRRYAAETSVKALAISTSGISGWMPTQRQALEICEFYARIPCLLYAIGKWVQPTPEPHPTLGPGVGPFNPAEIPFVSYTARDLLSSVYGSAANAKALAVSPRGNYGLAGDAATIEEAQRLALERCQNAENSGTSTANRQRCYVYAVGDTVVLAKRATAPITEQR